MRGGVSMAKLNEEDLTSVEIDLTSGDKLDESWLRMLGFGIKSILGRMFGNSSVPVSVKGSRSDVESFTKTVGREKRYLDSIKRYGLDNPKTFKDKSRLSQAVGAFERKTGLKWPFK